MNYKYYTFPSYDVSVELSFCGTIGQATEFHLMFHVSGVGENFQTQLKKLHRTYAELMNDELLKNARPCLKRYFLSDAANQTDQLKAGLHDLPACATSIVQQSPLNGSKIALWCYLVADMNSGYEHIWTVERNATLDGSEQQTAGLLQQYEVKLEQLGCTLANNCIRTWFFVRDVDVNYRGVVKARKENFELQGLTNHTHYIASTGIQGSDADPAVKVLMDAYAIKGLKESQITYLYAREYLNSTYDYGVTFERGVCVDFGDRRQVYISGTASIDNKGQIMYAGDVSKQVQRMWINVEALLAEASCNWSDVMQAIVYLRDMSDYDVVRQMFSDKFPSVPYVLVLAPICRPGWLVEMECVAVKMIGNPQFGDL
jgi:enamine deaminase RidA (YjgF/YER057c/UK114 family)